jgi:hypothetical protein
MNVFMLSWDHDERARHQRDDHVNKLLTEAVQLMNNALYLNELDEHTFYGKSHLHHPWSEWAAESVTNWAFLDEHAAALGREYLYRSKYSDTQQTADRKRAELWDADTRLDIADTLPDRGLTTMPICTKDFEPNTDDVVGAYREYYINRKIVGDERAVWTDRDQPEWSRKV